MQLREAQTAAASKDKIIEGLRRKYNELESVQKEYIAELEKTVTRDSTITPTDDPKDRIAQLEALLTTSNQKASSAEKKLRQAAQELSESKLQIESNLAHIATLEGTVRAKEEEIKQHLSTIKEKETLMLGQKQQLFDSRAQTAEKQKINDQLEKDLLIAKQRHVPGQSAHDEIVNPTDISTDWPAVAGPNGLIKSYTEAFNYLIRDHIEKREEFKKFLINKVKPSGKTKDMDTKHLHASLMSSLLFANFHTETFFPMRDECSFTKLTVKKNHGLLQTRMKIKEFDDCMREYPEFAAWVNDFLSRLKETMQPVLVTLGLSFDTIISVEHRNVIIMKSILKAVYNLHNLFFAFYPRPDLIIRTPGSKNLRLCTSQKKYISSDDEDDISGTAIGFMILPGISFEKTEVGAYCYFHRTDEEASV